MTSTKRKLEDEPDPDSAKRARKWSPIKLIDSDIIAMRDKLPKELRRIYSALPLSQDKRMPAEDLKQALQEVGYWKDNDDAEKERERKQLFDKYLVWVPATDKQREMYRLRDVDQALEQRCEELKSQLAEKEYRVHTIATALEQERKALLSSTRAMAEEKREAAALRHELEMAKAEKDKFIALYQEQMKELHKKSIDIVQEGFNDVDQAVKQEMQKFVRLAEDLDAQLAEAKCNEKRLHDNFTDAQKRIVALQYELLQAIRAKQQLEQEIEQFRENFNAIEKQHKQELEQQKAEWVMNEKELKAHLEAEREQAMRATVAEAKCKALTDHAVQLVEKIDMLASEKKKSDEKAKQLEKEAALEDEDVEDLKNDLVEAAVREKKLKAQKEEAERTTEELEDKLTAKEKEIEALTKACDDARSDADCNDDLYRAAEMELKELRDTATLPDFDAAWGFLRFGDIVALQSPESKEGGDYWLAQIIKFRQTKRDGEEIQVMYYEEAGDEGYRAWARGDFEWVGRKYVYARIQRVPVNAKEREHLQKRLRREVVADP